jgi:hypothetical protein
MGRIRYNSMHLNSSTLIDCFLFVDDDDVPSNQQQPQQQQAASPSSPSGIRRSSIVSQKRVCGAITIRLIIVITRRQHD